MGPLKTARLAACLLAASLLCARDSSSLEDSTAAPGGNYAPGTAGEAVIVATGDIRLDGPVGRIIEIHGPHAPTAAVRDPLKGDVVFGNLECPVTQRGTKVGKKWNFRAPPENLKALQAAGFNLLNLANNHVMDYGPQGLEDTLRYLKQADLPYIGAGLDRARANAPHFKTVGKLKLGFLGFTSTFPKEAWATSKRAGVAYSDFDRFPEIIRRTRAQCDVLIVSFHGGTELAPEPNEIQKAFGRAAIDAGADLVIGHHPHVIQPIEAYKGKFILHSLGNFLFVSPTPETRWTLIARIRASSAGIQGIDLVPLDINYGRPRSPSTQGREKLRSLLNLYGTLEQFGEILGLREGD